MSLPPEIDIPEKWNPFSRSMKATCLCDVRDIEMSNRQVQVVWIPKVLPKNSSSNEEQRYEYLTPNSKRGLYPNWVQPKVLLFALTEHNNDWVKCACSSLHSAETFFFPKTDLYLPAIISASAQSRLWRTSNINSSLSMLNQNECRDAIASRARYLHDGVTRSEKLSLSDLRRLMRDGKCTKLSAVNSIWACYGDTMLAEKYLRATS